jgi:hypothetical protein
MSLLLKRKNENWCPDTPYLPSRTHSSPNQPQQTDVIAAQVVVNLTKFVASETSNSSVVKSNRPADHLVLPAVFRGLAGVETNPPSSYKVPWLPPLNLDVLPVLLRGFSGSEASPPPTYKVPGLSALNLDVLPALLRGFSGSEASPPPTYKVPGLPALNLDVLPALLRGFSGIEASPPPAYKVPWLPALNLDVLPALLRGFSGIEASLPPAYKVPWLPALNLNVLPALLRGFSGIEASPPPSYKVPGLSALNLDVLPALLRGFSGIEASPPPTYKVPWLPALNLDVLPALLRGLSGIEASLPPTYKVPWLPALNLDVLPALLRGFSGIEASLPPAYKVPWLPALNLDVLPARLLPILQVYSGFETISSSPYRIPGLRSLNIDVLPTVLQGFAGFEASPALQYKISSLRALNLDVLPNLLRGLSGFEASLPPAYRASWRQAANLDVLPSVLQGFAGFEASPALQYKIPNLSSLNLEVLFAPPGGGAGWQIEHLSSYQPRRQTSGDVDSFYSIYRPLGPWGFVAETPHPYRVPLIKVDHEDLFPQPSRLSHIEVESTLPLQYKIRPLQALNLDVLPNVQLQSVYPYAPDFSDVALRYLHPLWIPSDDYWPGLIVPPTPPSRLGVGGGEYVCETEEDINRRECLEKTIQAIDGELAELERKDRAPSDLKIIEPDVMPPDWQAGDDEYSQDERGYWYDPRDPNTYGRPVRPRSKAGKRSGEPFPGRHVHYNFASDMDFGVRRRIIGILDRAEHRGAQIFGSDAFVTQLEGNIQGHLIVPGTNAWVVQLGPEERLAVAREAVAEGFRLVSFDDTSLSFIHRPTYPWKTLFLGATLGAGLMGAGVGVGYLAWGRDLKRLQASENSSPKPKSRKKK